MCIGLMRRAAELCVVAATAAFLLVGAARAGDAPDPVVAQRGAVTLTASQVREILAAADPDARQQMERDPGLLIERVRERMMQLVLLDRARADKWDARPDVAYRAELAKEAAIVESFLSAQVPLPPDFPTDQDIVAAYDANKSKLMLPRRFHLAQLLIAEPSGVTSEAKSEAEKRAAELRRQVLAGHKDFATIAKAESDDKGSAEKGGDLGWIREDILLAPLRKGLAGLSEGDVSQPIETPDGWHVLKVLGIRPAGTATLAEARDTLVRALRQDRALQLQRRYVNDLLRRDPIRIDQVELWKQTAR
jgi:peptidylprolyl isomerase